MDHIALLEEIRHDNRSGATALLHRAANAFRCATDALPAEGVAWRQMLTDVARAVATVRPPFGGFVSLASAVLTAADAARDATEARQRSRATIDAFLATQQLDAADCVERAGSVLAGVRTPAAPARSPNEPTVTVLTVSASSLVERALVAAASATPLSVVCLESRPAGEGTTLAGRLAEAGCPVSLAIDAAGPALVAGADAVVLGCDTLAPAGLAHKIGTLGVALAARRRGVPVYALAGPEKLLPALVQGALADGGPPDEILADRPAGLAIVNRYFDLTPLDLLTGVILPDGLLDPGEASRRASAVTVHPGLADLL